MKKVTFYFDGFNFHNGLKAKSQEDISWKKFYWIDFVKFCQQFLSSDQEINKVKYFTSPPLNHQKKSRQATLFAANKILNPNKFEIIEGKYYNKSVKCKNCYTIFQQPEEKRTDVNISIEMLMDCFNNNTDTLVLVTADSDLVTTVQTIKKNFPDKKVKVYFPPKRTSFELHDLLKKVSYLEANKKRFENSVMENKISTPDGTKTYTIPAKWDI